MHSLISVFFVLVVGQCATDIQLGTAVAKSDKIATVNFMKSIRTTSSPYAATSPAPEKEEEGERGLVGSSSFSPPPFPTTNDVNHSTDDTHSLPCIIAPGDPPDINGAVGETHLFTALNYRLQAQKRDGTVVGMVYPVDFFKDVLDKDVYPFDPRLHYDHFAKKWIISYCAKGPKLGNACLLIAISNTEDPTGDWTIHRIIVDPKDETWIDYARLAFNENRIIITGLVGARPGFTAPARFHCYVFDKSALGAGGTGSHTRFELEFKYWGVPAVDYDAGSKVLRLVQIGSGYGEGCVFEISDSTSGLQLSHLLTVKPKWNWTEQRKLIPQKGTECQLMALDLEGHALIRNSEIWFVHSTNFTSKDEERASIQWWQIDLFGKVLQQGQLDDPNGVYSYIFPTIAVSAKRDVLIGYTRCSEQDYPSACYAFRQATDPIEKLGGDYLFKKGELPFGTPNPSPKCKMRWGDYSSSCVDPTDDSLWTLQQYSARESSSGSYTTGLYWKRQLPTSTAQPDCSKADSAYKGFIEQFMPAGPYGKLVAVAIDPSGSNVRVGAIAFTGVAGKTTDKYQFQLKVKVTDRQGKEVLNHRSAATLTGGDEHKLGVYDSHKSPASGVYVITTEITVTHPDGKEESIDKSTDRYLVK